MSDLTGPLAAPPLFRPDADHWLQLMSAEPAGADAIRFREQMGLDVDKPIVMSGHQAGIWHPGIAAKWFACAASAEAFGAQAVWIVPDQDDNDPTQIAYPTISEFGSLGRATWSVGPAERGVSNAKRSAVLPAAAPAGDTPFASDGVGIGLAQIREKLAVHARAATLAEQFAGAAADLLSPLCAQPTIVYASQITQADAFGALVESMFDDPRACAAAYNTAASGKNAGGVRTLKVDEEAGRFELPVWALGAHGRSPVFASGTRPEGELAPRALMMTAMLRSFACELFVHGTGGAGIDGDGGYERVGDQWWRAWQGDEPRAKVVMTTATRTLTIAGDIPTPEAVGNARARAHKARHDPSVIGDDETAERKRALLASIEAMTERSEKPGALFREMQELLAAYRERRADDLAQLERDAAQLEERAGDAAIAHDRTWAFPLYEPRQIESLRDQVFAAFGLA